MKRIIFGVLGGLVTGIILIGLIESYAHKLYPPPVGSDFNNKEALKEMMLNMPVGAYLSILAAYIIGAFGGGVVATLIDKSGNYLPALIVSGLLLLAGIANFAMLPHPVWFMIISSFCYPVFGVAGAWVVKKFQARN